MLYGLGRWESPDDRDLNFLLSSILPTKAAGRKYRYWNESKIRINQGSVPACVGAAWVHFLVNGPTTQKPAKLPNFIEVYKAAQKVDEWPGESYAGTSVRAGAKVLKAMGFIDTYLWAFNVEELINAVLNVGPVVVGTNWYRGMSWPNEKGIIRPTGRLDGGHAYLINGVNVEKELFRMEQSWDPRWGDTGNAWISFEDMRRLINEWGEVCLAMELKK